MFVCANMAAMTLSLTRLTFESNNRLMRRHRQGICIQAILRRIDTKESATRSITKSLVVRHFANT
ncbi:hypothetical protein FHW77_005428 [Agrobacterium sp. RC10-4-1]|nr:hypothetical protein [Agrobacterium sp. RC10-4-1]MDP9773202.1 hypothetical protein [Rhizobium sp. SORGH_AS_0755]